MLDLLSTKDTKSAFDQIQRQSKGTQNPKQEQTSIENLHPPDNRRLKMHSPRYPTSVFMPRDSLTLTALQPIVESSSLLRGDDELWNSGKISAASILSCDDTTEDMTDTDTDKTLSLHEEEEEEEAIVHQSREKSQQALVQPAAAEHSMSNSSSLDEVFTIRSRLVEAKRASSADDYDSQEYNEELPNPIGPIDIDHTAKGDWDGDEHSSRSNSSSSVTSGASFAQELHSISLQSNHSSRQVHATGEQDELSDVLSRNRRVRFGLKASQLRVVESHKNYTHQERNQCWWNEREIDRRMSRYDRLAEKYDQKQLEQQSKEQQRHHQKRRKRMKKPKKRFQASSWAGNVKIGGHYYRGLEAWTTEGSLTLECAREQCTRAVMDEQDQQWRDRDENPYVIAIRSLVATYDSSRRARWKGLQDAKEALKVQEEIWSSNTKHSRKVDEGNGEWLMVSSAGATTGGSKKKDEKRKNSNNDGSCSDACSIDGSPLAKAKKKIKRSKRLMDISNHKFPSSKKTEDNNGGNDAENAPESENKKRVARRNISKHKLLPSRNDARDDEEGEEKDAPASRFVRRKVSNHKLPGTKKHTSQASKKKKKYTGKKKATPKKKRSSNLVDTMFSSRDETLRGHCDVIDDDDDLIEDYCSPLLQTLRRQQKLLASQSEQLRDDSASNDDDSSKNSSFLISKDPSLRQDYRNRIGDRDSSVDDSLDPSGRRQRKLASKHVDGASYHARELTNETSKHARGLSCHLRDFSDEDLSAVGDVSCHSLEPSDENSKHAGGVSCHARELFNEKFISGAREVVTSNQEPSSKTMQSDRIGLLVQRQKSFSYRRRKIDLCAADENKKNIADSNSSSSDTEE